MRLHSKPVRKCNSCLLNLGDRCWQYRDPRGQWRGRRCPAFENEAVYEEFRRAQKQPTVKTREALRRDAFRAGGKGRTRHTYALSRHAP